MAVSRGQNGFLEPYEGDCTAATTALRLAPLRVNKDNASNVRRQEFLRVWWGVFSTPGLFARMATELNLLVGDRDLENFPFVTSNIDVLTVVRWALDHGIGATSRVVTTLEGYAPHTLARQSNLGLFPQRTIDAWVHEFEPQLRNSHTLRYPPPIGSTVITTSSEVQLIARTPAAGTGVSAPAAVVPVPPPVPAPSTSQTPAPTTSSADTDVVAGATAATGDLSAPSAQEQGNTGASASSAAPTDVVNMETPTA